MNDICKSVKKRYLVFVSSACPFSSVLPALDSTALLSISDIRCDAAAAVSNLTFMTFSILLHWIALLYIWQYTLQQQQQFVFDFHDFLNYCCRICGAHVSHVAHRASVSAKSAEKSQNLMLSKSFTGRLCFRAFQGKLGWGTQLHKFAFIGQFDSDSNSG